MVKKPITWHVNEEGLSNEVISDFMSLIMSKGLYLGVFPWYKLNKKEILSRDQTMHYPFGFIVNTGGHFVSVVVRDKDILYTDSFAAPIPDPLRAFFLNMNSARDKKKKKNKRKNVRRAVLRNNRQIQSFSSTHCGLYAALFTIWNVVPKEALQHINEQGLTFSRTNLEENDALCVRYLKNCIRSIVI